MTSSPKDRRPGLRVNPVEVIALFVVGGVFFNSLYRLFNEKEAVTAALLRPVPAGGIEGERSLASSAKLKPVITSSSVELSGCEAKQEIRSGSTSVRISGRLCFGDSVTIVDLETGAHYAAALDDDGRFVSEYVPNGKTYRIVFLSRAENERDRARAPAADFGGAVPRAQSSLVVRLSSEPRN